MKDGGRNELLGCHGITDGSFSLQVKVPSGGSVSPNGGYRYLDVVDPAEMKDGLDRVSLANFVAAARGAVERSGVDPLLALDRAARAGALRDGELVLLLAAGTGYTWAASVVRWGDD